MCTMGTRVNMRGHCSQCGQVLTTGHTCLQRVHNGHKTGAALTVVISVRAAPMFLVMLHASRILLFADSVFHDGFFHHVDVRPVHGDGPFPL